MLRASFEIRGTEGEVTVPLRVPPSGLSSRELTRFFQVLDMARLDPPLLDTSQRAVVSGSGKVLFDVILPGEARMLYNSCRSSSRWFNRNLRLVLRIGPPDLMAMPWEFIYDNESGMFPCLEYPVVRYVEQPLAAEDFQPKAPVRILGMIAAPQDQPDLSVAEERAAVESTMHTLIEHELVKLDWVRGGTWKDLERKFYKRQYQAFHFIGHGGFARHANEGYPIFAGDDGPSDPIPASEVAALLPGSTSPSWQFSIAASLLEGTDDEATPALQKRLFGAESGPCSQCRMPFPTRRRPVLRPPSMTHLPL